MAGHIPAAFPAWLAAQSAGCSLAFAWSCCLVHMSQSVEADPPHPQLCSALCRLSQSELSPALYTICSAARGFPSEEGPGWRDSEGIPGG